MFPPSSGHKGKPLQGTKVQILLNDLNTLQYVTQSSNLIYTTSVTNRATWPANLCLEFKAAPSQIRTAEDISWRPATRRYTGAVQDGTLQGS